MRTAKCGDTRGQECRAKGSRKDMKCKSFMYGDTTNVEYVMYD
jgi:hypothetical protein